MMAHTPGPWFAVEANSMKYCSVVEFEYGSGARGTVGLVGSDGVTVGASSLNQQNANARLIAAAPDLLVALKDCVARLRTCSKLVGNADRAIDGICEAFDAAIRKAETGQ